MLPDMDGLALVARLRAEQIATPVLMISSLSDVDDRIAGCARAATIIWSSPSRPTRWRCAWRCCCAAAGFSRGRPPCRGRAGDDLIARKVWLAGEPVSLLPKEYRLLEFLARHAGQVVGRQMIFEQVWGYFFEPADNLINVHIGKLRRKLERPGHPSPIQTVKGEGYRLDID
jgi:two-component system OmpR family response regulator